MDGLGFRPAALCEQWGRGEAFETRGAFRDEGTPRSSFPTCAANIWFAVKGCSVAAGQDDLFIPHLSEQKVQVYPRTASSGCDPFTQSW